jgi:hypothetical protein
VSFITVVSGLPRSGTSLMMQMLVAGGIAALTDGARAPDEDNPRGYFEYEPVKRTRREPSWLPQASNKAVKVVHALLDALPAGFEYRVILMKRPIAEVLISQRLMLERSGKLPAPIPAERLERVFRRKLQDAETWMTGRPGFRVLAVNYPDCVYRPATTASAIREFLGFSLNAEAMAAVVDQSLHRNRFLSGAE